MQLSIGTTISSWTVKGFGSWGKNNTVKYTLMEHKCGNTRKFQQWEIDNNKFKKCKKCEARVEYRKNAEHIIYKTMYRQYKHSAKQRSHSFELEYDDFNMEDEDEFKVGNLKDWVDKLNCCSVRVLI